MPIRIPDSLPARAVLESENIFVMTEFRAMTQDIRPLKILLLNLMPTKIATETQFSRLLGNSPLQVELTLMHTRTHKSKNTSEEHLLAFYKTFEEIKDQYFDGIRWADDSPFAEAIGQQLAFFQHGRYVCVVVLPLILDDDAGGPLEGQGVNGDVVGVKGHTAV